MKLIALFDGSKENFKELSKSVKTYSEVYSWDITDGEVLYTNEADAVINMVYLYELVNAETGSKIDIGLIRFSGDTNVAKEVGDEVEQMVIPMSFKNDTRFYHLDPNSYKEDFKKLVQTFTS